MNLGNGFLHPGTAQGQGMLGKVRFVDGLLRAFHQVAARICRGVRVCRPIFQLSIDHAGCISHQQSIGNPRVAHISPFLRDGLDLDYEATAFEGDSEGGQVNGANWSLLNFQEGMNAGNALNLFEIYREQTAIGCDCLQPIVIAESIYMHAW